MKSLEEISESLKDRNITEVSRRTGIHKNTLYKILKLTGNPTYSIVKTISDYIEGDHNEK